MYQIALCEDDAKETKLILEMLREYDWKQAEEIPAWEGLECERFPDAEALLARMSGGFRPDLLLVDIYLPGKTGLEAVAEMRKAGNRATVIFLTTSLDHALSAYALDARQYLVKPIEKERLFDVLDQFLEHPQDRKRKSIIVREHGEPRKIFCDDILYCETKENYQALYLCSPEEGEAPPKVSARLSAGQMWEMLEGVPGFARLGSTYIINRQRITSMQNGRALFDGGLPLSLSQRRFLDLKKKYFDFFKTPKPGGKEER